LSDGEGVALVMAFDGWCQIDSVSHSTLFERMNYTIG